MKEVQEIQRIPDVLIVFGDNDFSMLGQRILENMAKDITSYVSKHWVVKYWNILAHSLYRCCQAFEFEEMRNPGWLTIDEDQVLIGGEIKKFLDENFNNANGEWFHLSTLHNGQHMVTII